MEYFELHGFKVSIVGEIASLVFLILPWFPQYFLYVLNETLSLLGSLYLSSIVPFKGGLSPLPLKISPFLYSHQKPPKFVPLTVKEKSAMKQIVHEATGVSIPNSGA